jgi:hypothetical protein
MLFSAPDWAEFKVILRSLAFLLPQLMADRSMVMGVVVGVPMGKLLGRASYRWTGAEFLLMANQVNDGVEAFASFEVGKNEGAIASHLLRIASHDFQIGPDIGGEINFVNDENV